MAKLLTVQSLMRSLPGHEGEQAQWRGITQEYFVLHGLTVDKEIVNLDGNPILTGMTTEQLEAFLAEANRLDLEAELEAAERGEYTARKKTEIVKDIDNLIALMKNSPFPSDIYAFEHDLVVHFHRVEKPLREYGFLETGTQVIHILGFIQRLPRPVEIGGQGFNIWYFDPLDFDEVEKGGMLRVQFLRPEQLIKIDQWLKALGEYGSVLYFKQKIKTLEGNARVDNRSLKEQLETIGDQKDRIRALQKEVGESQAESRSNTRLSVMVSQMGIAALMFTIGFIISLALPQQVSCTSSVVVNATLGTERCVERILSYNIYAFVLPSILTFIGMIIGGSVAPMRWFREKVPH